MKVVLSQPLDPIYAIGPRRIISTRKSFSKVLTSGWNGHSGA
ncbi:hypothetical protein XHV734_1953 [Xanthomonas hortorum pv. vitians]|nr:hypothetical protein XHV734_1953 [Xanthomonas hortorum pv. vitians]